MALKIKLDKKDPKKKVVKYSTDKDDSAVSSLYISNEAVEKLGDPDSIVITVAAG